MATYVKGSPVANATSYELSEKAADGTYSVLATGAEINFEVSALGLAIGDHVLVVKAKADSYTDSDYSNEVTYNVPDSGEYDITTLFTDTFRSGAIIAGSAESNYGRIQANQVAYQCSGSFVDVTEYESIISNGASLIIAFPGAINTAHSKYGLVFYNDNVTANSPGNILGAKCLTYEAVNFGVYTATLETVAIPAGTKYIKTTWVPAANTGDVDIEFSAKIVRNS